MSNEIIAKRIVLQKKGISATHPIIFLERRNDFVICSVASKEGNSNFDYSLIIKKDGISLDLTDEELIEKICLTVNYIESNWGFSLALANGLTKKELEEMFELINIKPTSKIRLSKATKI
ncbi:MAG: hypothetical protein ACTSSG_07310 [Candidatus Heimdallarchaeaceae archaeon]